MAKGYTQKEWVDFKEVFSHMVKNASIRVIMALTTVNDIELDQLNPKQHFCMGDYMKSYIWPNLKNMKTLRNQNMYVC